MNPPSALHGAMSRDRKPFTYTPGGLDLSEIKSSRMAARLMRNAMNEGVPELPKNIQSPPISSNPVAVPNFNCLPVQVFPSFNLPANPKSLLRTRSNPGQPRDLPMQGIAPAQPSQLINKSRASGSTHYDAFNKISSPYSQIYNNRPVSMFEYGSPNRSYGNDNDTPSLPEISYDAEYLRMPLQTNSGVVNTVPSNTMLQSTSNENQLPLPNTTNSANILSFDITNQDQSILNKSKHEIQNEKTSLLLDENSIYQEYLDNAFKPQIKNNVVNSEINETHKNNGNIENSLDLQCDKESRNIVVPDFEINNYEKNLENMCGSSVIANKGNSPLITEYVKNGNNSENDVIPKIEYTEKSFHDNNNHDENFPKSEVPNNDMVLDIDAKPTTDYSTFAPDNALLKCNEDQSGSDNQKKEVKIVKKQVIDKETNVKDQNGSNDQNGDSEVDAVIKLPAKKSAAKTETKVEVTKKTLPDGSVEEVKKTITKTTIDGRTEIKTKTETTIIPKEDDEEEIEEIEEEENGEATAEEKNKQNVVVEEPLQQKLETNENGHDNIVKTEERSETTTTTSKKVVVIQDQKEEEKEEEEEEELVEEYEEPEETEAVTFVIKQTAVNSAPSKQEASSEAEAEEEEDENVDDVENDVVKEPETADEDVEIIKSDEKRIEKEENEEDEVEEEEEYEEAEEKEIEESVPKDLKPDTDSKDIEKSDETVTEEVADEQKKSNETITNDEAKVSEVEDTKQEQTQEVTVEKTEALVEKQEIKGEKQNILEETVKQSEEKPETPQPKVPLREPSVPLEKVEDVEIKPLGLGDFLTKTSTESREIITNVTDKPTGLLTEINRIENIVTVNRTTKTLDRSYEDITQQGIPTLKTYFTPHIDKIMTSPQPARPYQPVYPPEPVTERRHSLLLERLSVERQLPSDSYQNSYQYSNQTVEQQGQWSQEPQAEVLTVSNVKPSQITNQQWYQQRENAIYNNVAPSPQPQAAAPSWTQPKSQPQPVYQPQPQYQPSPQPQYQTSPQPQQQPQYQAPLQTQAQYQPTYTENIQENTSNTYQNTYSTYTPKPTNWTSNNTKPISPIPTIITPSQPSQYNYLNKDSSESYQKTTQHFTSSYVPPPWEQDSTYVAPDTSSQNYYQPPPQTSSFSPAPSQGWKPNPPPSKFNKTSPTAYIPPKPNQSFVKPVIVEPPRMPGRKTYYSEYERRYISVPESTYIPGESKFQPQPDPSPAYYYDNNEPAETVEPQWRRELREFTEKSQSQTTTETNVKPPWEAETKYAKPSEPSYTPTPTWSQTVRPQSWRERSFESEFVSQEWPKTNTLGRGRPLSSYGKETIPERTRGVSVDRYNPNSYQSPVAAEHPPVQTHTHVPPAPHATGYHNPNVPAYHARASAEPREQVSYQQPRNYREARASPFQSRSFKYLQWITGTDD